MSSLHLTKILRLALAGSLLASLGACSLFHKKTDYAGSDGDFVNGTPLPERQDGVSFMGASVDKNRFAPVHFAFDSYVVEPSESGKLDAVLQFFKGGASGQLIIAGFTDERGTAEYNRGLGEKRAQAVRAYLLEHGVDTARIQTTSFGSEMPADSGHSEAAWAKNRRVEFGVTK